MLCVRYRLIEKGDDGFWQDVVVEGVPLYCALCKHLDHSADACFVTNPGFQKPQQSIGQVQDTVAYDKCKMFMPDVVVQHTVDRATHVVVAEHVRFISHIMWTDINHSNYFLYFTELIRD